MKDLGAFALGFERTFECPELPLNAADSR